MLSVTAKMYIYIVCVDIPISYFEFDGIIKNAKNMLYFMLQSFANNYFLAEATLKYIKICQALFWSLLLTIILAN